MSAPATCRALTILVLSLSFFLLVTSPAIARNDNSLAPAIDWQYVYGGTGSDVAYNAAPTADGGAMVLGVTKSYGSGSYDTWLLRLDAQGKMIWNRTYGGQYGDWCYDIAAAEDGHFYFTGATYNADDRSNDIWLVKVNGTGDVIWSKTYGGAYNDCGFGVVALPDGGCAITGYRGVTPTESDFFLMKIDANGNAEWDRTYDNGVQDWGKAVSVTPDGECVVCGWTKAESNSKAQLYAIKTDASGIQQWSVFYGSDAGDSYGYGVTRTSDGGYILGGHTNTRGNGGMDILGIKVDSGGHTLWEKTYGGAKDDYGYKAVEVSDGLVFSGSASSFDPSLWELFLVKADSNGNEVWNTTYGPANTGVHGGITFRTADNGFLFVGNTNEYGSGQDDVLVLKVAGTSAPVPVPEDIGQKATVTVAAVAAGTGLSFLALFMGRIFDYLSTLTGKAMTGLNELLGSIGKIPIVGTLYNMVYGYFKTYIKGMIFGRINKIKAATAAERTSFLAGFSAAELLVLAISAALLGIAYIFAKKLDLLQLDTLVLYIVMAGLVTSLHDLTHRYYAYKYKTVAEYKFWWFGTLVMFLTALGLGVTYAVPARTIINKAGEMSVKEQAIVFLSGPLVSGILALAFLLLVPFGGALRTIGLLGVSMNLLSAVYSLTPFPPMDGNKVYKWRKALWALTFVPLMLLYLGVTILVQ